MYFQQMQYVQVFVSQRIYSVSYTHLEEENKDKESSKKSKDESKEKNNNEKTKNESNDKDSKNDKTSLNLESESAILIEQTTGQVL